MLLSQEVEKAHAVIRSLLKKLIFHLVQSFYAKLFTCIANMWHKFDVLNTWKFLAAQKFVNETTVVCYIVTRSIFSYYECS